MSYLRCAVMGNPIAHSLSPIIHTHFAKQVGIDLSYERILSQELSFSQDLHAFFQQGGKGVNVTLPFKTQAFALAEEKTLRCQIAKAANTLWMQEGRLQADNTDGHGCLQDLCRYRELLGKKILILGAGGAARGIIGPLLEAKPASLTVVNRTQSKLLALSEDFPLLRVVSLTNFNPFRDSYDLIINAGAPALVEALKGLNLRHKPFCYDLNYSATEPTAFMALAREQGCEASDGLGMLVFQAAEAFYLWFNFKPDTREILTQLRRSNLKRNQ